MSSFAEVELKHQQQATNTSCVAACIAMVTGIDQLRIISQMEKHDGGRSSMHDEFRQWVRMGYLPRRLPYGDLRHGAVMVATVPSLNIPGGNHRIVIDHRKCLKVLDPNEGREGKLFYTADSLRTWSELTIVENVY